jgi:hypothetical protein
LGAFVPKKLPLERNVNDFVQICVFRSPGCAD